MKNNKKLIERYKRGYYLTVGQLKKELEGYPDDALVVSQRVEDMYYEQAHGWDTITKPDPMHAGIQQQYSPVWCVVRYKDDTECLYLDLHY